MANSEDLQRNASLLSDSHWHAPTPPEWIIIQPNKDPENAGQFIELP